MLIGHPADDEPLQSLHMAVFSESLEGFYQGEITNHIRQLCALKRYTFSAVRTGSVDTYNLPLGLSKYDGVIVIRNAISKNLAAHIKEMGVPIVSIGYEYSDTGIPYVGSDNEAGVTLALDHLQTLNSSYIGFVGNLAEFDHLHRLDVFKKIHSQRSLKIHPNLIMDAKASSFLGGQKSAEVFINSGIPCSAVLCVSGLIGLGFVDYLNNRREEENNRVSVVSFDPIAITPLIAEDIVTVDQNLHLISYRSVNLIERMIENKPVVSHQWVQPRLIMPSEDMERQLKSYLRTATESVVSENTNYMKCVSSNCFEWTHTVAASNMADVMSLSILFKRYMCYAAFSVVNNCEVDDSLGETALVQLKEVYTRCGMQEFDIVDNNKDIPAALYSSCSEGGKNFVVASHFPVFLFGKHWGILTFYGVQSDNEEASSYLSFASYIDIICTNISSELERCALQIMGERGGNLQEAVVVATKSILEN